MTQLICKLILRTLFCKKWQILYVLHKSHHFIRKIHFIVIIDSLFISSTFRWCACAVMCGSVGCVQIIPDCPGGGIPDGSLGRCSSTVRTPARLPQHGSMATSFGTPCVWHDGKNSQLTFRQRQESVLKHNSNIVFVEITLC